MYDFKFMISFEQFNFKFTAISKNFKTKIS